MDIGSAIFRRRNSDILLALAGERTGAGDERRRGARLVKETIIVELHTIVYHGAGQTTRVVTSCPRAREPAATVNSESASAASSNRGP
jgi:hypothetical protein